MKNIEFKEKSNYLKIEEGGQEGKYVRITKGTFSNKIYIRTSNLSKFQSNLLINLEAPGFKIVSQDIYVYLGDQEQAFRIGVSNELLEKVYSLQIKKKEFGLKPIYNVFDNMIVFVMNAPVVIQMPQIITVPLGGCSLPEKIQIGNVPYENVEIVYEFANFLEMNIELSTFTSTFNSETSFRYLSFCALNSNVQAINTEINMKLSGINKNSYQLAFKDKSTNVIIAEVVQKDKSIKPTLNLSVFQTKRSYAKFLVQANTNGVVYWNISVIENYVSKSLEDIKILIKESNTIIQQTQDILYIFQGNKKDQRIGLIAFKQSNVDQTYIDIDELIPETKYIICVYFDTEFRQATEEQCLNFTTLVSFNKYAFSDNINDVLCFYVSQSQTRIKNIINADGLSCSRNAMPEQYYFKYKGVINSNANKSTNIYLIPDLQFENDQSINVLKDLYDAMNIIQDAKNKFNINYISQTAYSYKFKYIQAQNKVDDFQIPNLVNISFKTKGTAYNSALIIDQLELSTDGQVYFIAERYAKAVYDPVKDQIYDSPIAFLKKPTPEQIVSCKNNINYKAELCFKAVYNNGQQIKFEITDLNPNTRYKIYYIIANHFPIIPIYGEQVYEEIVLSSPYGGGLISNGKLICFSLIIFITKIIM
ncbi:hypothetical protein IMG5_150770 [Ichthyophthirius multifiliis]|uniref:Uncharacterized protein n=1 Tax=Ichthyophthirius multifiliis TaxID=5932 RepID=G0QYM5_ICHMU|nr:hypothetical protein IMG5_150770 [Ichthyophthirius multifiliis]EGR29681.1 hypothetical protein IMG5_150770 [Ichthyophthirius multifiliis]|eukprot:XP_004030917.1 hypothetical protein IMG5_150770 [Ichthyophthirius multifiliis]